MAEAFVKDPLRGFCVVSPETSVGSGMMVTKGSPSMNWGLAPLV